MIKCTENRPYSWQGLLTLITKISFYKYSKKVCLQMNRQNLLENQDVYQVL